MIIARVKLSKNSNNEAAFKSYFKQYIDSIPNHISAYKLDSYLSKLLHEKVTYKDIIRYAIKYMSVINNGKEYIIEVTDNLNYKDINITSLLKLIKYGSLGIRGNKSLDNACLFALYNM